MSTQLNLSRRRTLTTAASLGAGFCMGVYIPAKGRARAQAPVAPMAEFSPNAFVHVGKDDIVTVVCKSLEFGQGPTTGFATLVAEELDADWSKVRALLAPADAVFKNGMFGQQGTGGSTSMASSFKQMREVGAKARAMFVAAAAKEWGVSAGEVRIKKGVISHESSSNSATLGEMAEKAAQESEPGRVTLKSPSDWNLIGKDLLKVDSYDKSRGKVEYTMDVTPEGAMTAVIAHPQVFGAKVESFEDEDALKVPGVVKVFKIPTGIAVVAENTYAALLGRDALKIKWSMSGAETRSSEEMIEDYDKAAKTPGNQAASKGNVQSALGSADKTIEVQYVFPFLAHAPMEPLDAVFHVEGSKATVWMGSQFQGGDRKAIAQVLGMSESKVTLHTQYAGGSFGRRAQIGNKFAKEAAQVAKVWGTQSPIKIMWTRVDDIRGGDYRPLTVHRLKGGIDKDGKIVAWDQVVASSPFFGGGGGLDRMMVEGAKDNAYNIPNFRVGGHSLKNGVPGLWWRSVGHTHTAFAAEVFLDELLALTGKDPVEARKEMLSSSPRHLAVLERVAKMANWSGTKPKDGMAMGVAVHKSFNSYVAQIAQVSKNEYGYPQVERVWCAVDCGIAVNPNIIRSQMESGIGYGLSAALFGEINLDKGGAVREANFNDYRCLRITEMPKVEVEIIESSKDPTGVGEPGTPPIAPAVTNAWRALTGEQIRRLPFARSVKPTINAKDEQG